MGRRLHNGVTLDGHANGGAVILLGDHQPPAVSGPGANREMPISIITRAPSVLEQTFPWHWQNGLLPTPSAPLEPMDAFRDQFLNTFSTKTPGGDVYDAGLG